MGGKVINGMGMPFHTTSKPKQQQQYAWETSLSWARELLNTQEKKKIKSIYSFKE